MRFRLSDYNVIALDLDNTLCEYNLDKLFKLQYQFLSTYLVHNKGYDEAFFPSELNEVDADFVRRGLFMDLKRGNILELRYDGVILKASHGTRFMDEESIERVYGAERRWLATDLYIQDVLAAWNGRLSFEVRSFLDFTDSIGTLLFAKLVDCVDSKQLVNKYNVWPDILEAIIDMYHSESLFIKFVYENKDNFIHECNGTVKKWLMSLKNANYKTVLITGSSSIIAQKTLLAVLGPSYKSFFSMIIYSSKKPSFFIDSSRSFTDLNDVPVFNLAWECEYAYGNWNFMYSSFNKLLNKKAKCVYIGDNIIMDVIAPSVAEPQIDSVAMIEEAASEGLFPECKNYPYSLYVSSGVWGSFFKFRGKEVTFFADILKRKAKLIIPNLKYIAEKPLNFTY